MTLIEPKAYDLKVSPTVQAVQWTAEVQASDIADWIEENWTEPSGGVMYDPDVSGAIGPAGEDWGMLDIDRLNSHVEVAPFDWVVRTDDGRFLVIEDKVFTRTYQPRES